MASSSRRAYAEDATDADEIAGRESEYVVIDVVKPWEVGFMVVDITKGVQKDGGLVSYPPVANATVVVTSRFNGKVAKGVTSDNGVVNIDIRELSVREEGEDEDNLDSYYFNGSVTITCDGFRTFETALMVVEGATGLQVPAHPSDDASMPYPHLASFDEWDALYTVNDFTITSANAGDHSITLVAANVPTSGSTTFDLWVDGEKSPRQSTTATIDSHQQLGATNDDPVYGATATATFKAPFLKKGDAAALPVGVKLKVTMTSGGTTYTWPLAVTTSEGVVDEPSGKEGAQLSPINTSGSSGGGIDVKWPSNIPLVGGGALKFWTPELPINIYVNPFGLVQLTLKSPSWGYLNDGGESDQNGWGKYPRTTVKQQWDKKVKVMNAMKDKTEALVSKPGAIQQIDLFKSFSIMVNFQLLALAKWDSSQGLFQGEVAGQITASLNFTISENFFAGPIPVLITFALDASLTFGLAAAAYSTKKSDQESLIEAVFDFSRWKWDYTNTGFTMTFSITPSLSVGVGIRGVASISVKGAITLTLYLGVPLGTQPEGLPSPHLTAGWSAQISLVLELFLFTKSFALYNKAFENFADNWDGKGSYAVAQAEDEALSALESLSFADLLGQLVPITDNMLSQTQEAQLSASALSTQGENEPAPIDWDAIATKVEDRLDDGTPMRYTVYECSVPMSEGEQNATYDDAAAGDAEEAAIWTPRVSDAPAKPDLIWLAPMAETDTSESGVAGLGSQGGIRPSQNTLLFPKVFGNPRGKVVAQGAKCVTVVDESHVHNYVGTYCFRIASVCIGDGLMRTRLIAICIDG